MLDDGSGFLSGMHFWVSDGMTAAPGGGAPSGGFSMSKSEMESLLVKAKATSKLIRQQLVDAADIARIDPPGDDPQSVSFTGTAVDAGNYYLGHLRIQQVRYRRLIEKLSTALGRTIEADEDAADAAKAAPKGQFE
ncbi:hypothetical protein [Amycolatopsis sp. NPDC059657]|uniref:hypothetical protein n=1 Tax=Amycolatopsis sp. NPDC059657 TaxID=3346899 RepID=UPI00366AC795